MAQNKQKYDRQLRIWGDHGQAALENAKVCVLNCGPTGTEALKNLVLGGIGSFTVVDGSLVEPADLGNNFLVDFESLGQSKAKCVSALLHELNEGVAAKFVEESAEALIETNPIFFRDFTLVIATQLPERLLLKLDNICREHSVQLLIARSYGLVGLIRVSILEHRVVESKPDNVIDDLRLHKPWPELLEYVVQFDLDIDDPMIHKHVPWGVILIKLAEEWKALHDGNLPQTSKDRSAFKGTVSGRKKEEDEDNYKEALAAAFKVWAYPGISSEVRNLLQDKAIDVNVSSPDFWVIVSALKEFIENEGAGELPLDGSIPDMHSFTDYYIGLQRIYQAQAEADVNAVEKHVRTILKRIGRDPLCISHGTIKYYCKNARNLMVLRFTTLQEEYSPRSGPELLRHLTAEDSSNAALYILLRACDHFAATYNRYPGVFDGESEEEDVTRLKAIALGLLNEVGAGGVALPEDLISEICRFGAGEIHCTAAVVGGIAAQEAIKFITGQFTPLPGTLVYNGMASTSSVFVI